MCLGFRYSDVSEVAAKHWMQLVLQRVIEENLYENI